MAMTGQIERYDAAAVEARWREIWEREGVFDVPNPAPGDTAERFYVLEMLPYPSGELHMGHVKNYTMGDVVTLYKRRNGQRVMHPMGYDAFGLPAENAAIRSGRHPAESTRENIAAIRRQMKRMGWSIDWNRELSTCEPDYYRWTQWIFLRLHEAGLAFRKSAVVKWCPKDQTVLANEQVIDGRCDRCGTEVEARTLDQWFFKITDYADRLLDDLEHVQWPERVVTMQRNWIGRSHGAEVLFTLDDGTELPISTETIYRYGEGPGTSSATKIGGGAAVGAILGAIIGGGKGAAVGATTGAGAGTVAVAATDRSVAAFPAGAEVTARILTPIGLTVEKARD